MANRGGGGFLEVVGVVEWRRWLGGWPEMEDEEEGFKVRVRGGEKGGEFDGR